MKKRLLICVFLAAGVVVHGQEIGLLPQQKASLTVSSSERNPFGKKPPKKTVEQAKVPVENEESRLRDAISELPLAGVVEARGGVKVLLGSIAIQENELLPALISGQTEQIRVISVTPKEVMLAFVDSDGTANNRKIRLQVDMTPSVRYKLGGSSATAAKDETKQESALGGVFKRNDSAPNKQ
ncbi:hypothetical protein TSACC_21829 [Terrimicrobium sacchariphilum]|uniref:Uncharacterized protein n=1 Tax=Terrimicrobium sacchariphilum TaxID=690879 RepID=A0A146G7U5_TERSA|nr:hypothetical protein [Terrimicrobium sacchariphilum]GAT33413.1 hypothetical protein TSACC_21829 [Terrimicrobium sacchariphilum]